MLNEVKHPNHGPQPVILSAAKDPIRVAPATTNRSPSAAIRTTPRELKERQYFTYVPTSKTGTLYTGVTNDLRRRVYQHKHGEGSAFTSRYQVNRLVYFEVFGAVKDAIAREKQIKGWRRARKIELIESVNPKWKDLSEEWE